MTRIYSAGAAVKGLIIDSTGAALTRSTNQSRAQEATFKGESFNISTGIINLTTAGSSGLFYYKHFEDSPLEIDEILLGLEDNGTDSNPTSLMTITKNPTAGTLISTATAVDHLINRNFSSVAALDNSLAYKGAEGHTVTDGTVYDEEYVSGGRNTFYPDVVLKKGNSITIQLDLQVNAALDLDVYVSLFCHLKQGD